MARSRVNGARLAYVVREVPGTVTREIINCVTKAKDRMGRATMVSFEKKEVKVPGGYLVYFPRGHVLRIANREMLRHHGLDKPAPVISMKGLNDPDGPMAKLFRAQDDDARSQVFVDMEKEVIALTEAKCGKVTVEVTS